jgi:PST family polysaccharide transporter
MDDNKSMVKSVPWTFVSFGATKVISLLTTVVLAHLLSPSDFGLMALATLAYGALGLFQDLGLGATLVLRQDFDEEEMGTILTLLFITSLAVTAIVIALAPVAASLLDQPRLNELLPVLAISAVFSTFAWFYESMFQREMEFKKRFVGQVVQTVTLAVTSIGLAIAGLGVWALVIGQVTSMLVLSSVYLAMASRRIRPRFDRGVAREVVRSGRGFLAQGWLAWISENVDYLVVGRVLGEAQLGFYSMAYRLGELTHFGIADPVAKITFPAFARMRSQGEDITTTYLSALRLVALLACVIGAVLSGAARPFTLGVFGSNWEPMIGPLAVLGIWAAVVPLQVTIGWLLNSTGHAGTVGTVTAILLIPAIPLLIVAAHVGATAVSWVILLQALLQVPLMANVIHRRLHIHIVPHMRALGPIVLATAAAWAASRLVAEATTGIAPVVSLLVAALPGVLVYAALVFLLDRGTVMLAVATARRMLRRDVATTAA